MLHACFAHKWYDYIITRSCTGQLESYIIFECNAFSHVHVQTLYSSTHLRVQHHQPASRLKTNATCTNMSHPLRFFCPRFPVRDQSEWRSDRQGFQPPPPPPAIHREEMALQTRPVTGPMQRRPSNSIMKNKPSSWAFWKGKCLKLLRHHHAGREVLLHELLEQLSVWNGKTIITEQILWKIVKEDARRFDVMTTVRSLPSTSWKPSCRKLPPLPPHVQAASPEAKQEAQELSEAEEPEDDELSWKSTDVDSPNIAALEDIPGSPRQESSSRSSRKSRSRSRHRIRPPTPPRSKPPPPPRPPSRSEW